MNAPDTARPIDPKLEADILCAVEANAGELTALLATLARIFHQDADFWPVLGEPDRARPSQPIDHSIGKTGMPEVAVQNGPETA